MKVILTGLIALASFTTFASNIVCTAEVLKSGKSYSIIDHGNSGASSLSFGGYYDMGIENADVWVGFTIDTLTETDHSYILNIENRPLDKERLELSELNKTLYYKINKDHSLIFSCN